MRAVVTGMGAVTALGRGVARQWEAMARGEDGIRAIERFATDAFDARLAGIVADRNGAQKADAALCIEYGVDAAREAAAAAGLGGVAADRIALVVGSSLGDERVPLHEVTEAIGDAIGARGPRLTISTACTSSTNAIGLALDLLEAGAADAVVAGGADVLTPLVHAGFHALGVLAVGKCAPFSGPPGTTLGEGAGFVVLERADAARARGAAAEYAVLGYGLSADAYHETGPDPSGAGVARALRGALAHAGVSAEQIGYVNAHGTGTAQGDPAELRALRAALGERAAQVPISASKSFLGHAQGAAGVVEVVATLAALGHGAVPPTRNFGEAHPNGPADPVAQATPRAHAYDYALCNNSGFGGANCAVVVGRAARIESAAAAARPIYAWGAGAVGPQGMRLDDLLGAGARGHIAASLPLAQLTPHVNPRGFDPSMRYLVAAAALALADAQLRVRGPLRERAGLVVGQDHVSAESHAALQRTIKERGLRYLSAAMFARMVLNATTGACSKALELKGPCSTLAAGDASGLAAAAYAAHLLAHRGDADYLVAGAVDEIGDEEPYTRVDGSDGAACVVLAAAPPPGERPRVRVAGWAIGGPRIDSAVRAALAMAGLGARDLDLGVGARVDALELPRWHDVRARVGDAGAATSALSLAAAVALVARGEARRAIVVAEPSASASCAIVLVREEGGA